MPRRPGQELRRAVLQLLAETGVPELDSDSRFGHLSRRDRQLARRLVLGVLRNRTLLDYYLARFLKSGRPDELPAPVLDILRLALFQLKFLDRVPDHAAVDQAVELTRDVGLGGLCGLVNGVLRNILRGWDNVAPPGRTPDPQRYLEIVYSHPGWMVGRYIERFGADQTESLLAANNAQAPLVLRDEAVAAGGESLLAGLLDGAGVEYRGGRYRAEAVEILTPGVFLPELPGFGEGLFYVQDEAAMLVGRLAAAGANEGLVVAACAAPGGKATHLARLMPAAEILACDSSARRIARLRANLARLGLGGRVAAVCCDARDPTVRSSSAALVLCDVPCTGTGVIRRKPEIRWRIGPDDLATLSELQYRILCGSAGLVAPGGRLVYSTCSLEPEENAEVVKRFLAGAEEFSLAQAGEYLPVDVVDNEGFLEVTPHSHGIDGAFAALMVRAK